MTTTYNTTSYTITSPVIAAQPIADTYTAQVLPLGFSVQATDPTYGAGEFVYAQGVASTVVGSVVLISKGQTSLASNSNGAGVIGVAMSANVADQYGYYQVRGYNPNVIAASGTAGDQIYLSATAGSVTTTSTSSVLVQGAVCSTAESGGVLGADLSSPTGNGLT